MSTHARSHLTSVAVAAAFLFLTVVAPIARADEPPAKSDREKVVLTGKLVCVGCHLEKAHGAEPQCTLHSKHAQGFLAEDGTIYTLLDNARGHFLVTDKKLKDRPVKLQAYRFPKAQVLEVVRYEVEEGGKWVAYDYCKHCGFEKGDNGGKDLCDDCAK
jgi:hypothetical protein